MSITTLITAEQLLRMPECKRGYELVAGELRKMSPPGEKHCVVAQRLGSRLGPYVEERRLGAVYGGEPGFTIARDPDTVLAPDLAFVTKDHLAVQPIGDGYREGAPDLAVEVMSPSDRPKEVREKAEAWLAAGAAMVWVLNPGRHTVTVFRPASGPETLTEADSLDGEEVVPGFRCPVADLFRLP